MNDEPRNSQQQAFQFLRIAWKRRLLVAAVVVLGASTALLLSLRAENVYSSTAQLLFRDPGFSQALFGNGGVFQSGVDPQRDTETNINVLRSRSVAAEARQVLGTRISVDDLVNAIDVQPSSNSDVVDITAKAGDPVEAAAIAQGFAEGYVRYRKRTDQDAVNEAERLISQRLKTASSDERPEILKSLNQLRQLEALQTGKAEVVGRAEANPTPVSPKPKRNAILGGAVALLLGCALAIFLETIDKRLRTIEEFEAAYPGYPIIATVPATAYADPFKASVHGPTAESFRMLREGLRFVDPTGFARCFLIVSAVESEGKSTVAANLANSLAAVGQRVILIEADLRRPTAAAALRVDRGVAGLSDLLVSDDRIDEYLVDVQEDGNLRVLSSGTIPPNPSDLLRAPRMALVLAAARNAAEVVIIDAPPLLPVSDSRVLLQLDEVDGVIVVGRSGVTRSDEAREAARVLDQSGRRVFGLAVTGAPTPSPSSYYDVLPPKEGKRPVRARS